MRARRKVPAPFPRNAGAPPTDQRGLPRKKDGNGDGVAVVDIGAFEK